MPATMAPILRHLRSILLGLVTLVSVCAPAWSAPPLTVFAAASLKESLDQAAGAYRAQGGSDVRIAYAASSALARQIEQGAPAQLFISADLDWMDYLQQRGRIVAGSQRELLGNRLVLIAPASSTVEVDLDKSGALSQALGSGRLAVAQTATVPAGKYARAALTSLGQWEGVQSRLAESENVRTTLMLVARGEVPLGVVYASDAKAETRVRVVATFPESSHPRIVYPLAAIAPASPAAVAFARWLEGPQGRAIFREHGFSVLD